MIASIEEWKHRALDANNYAYYANLNIAAIKAGKVTLEEKLEAAVTELNSVPKVAKVLGRAFDLGYLENRPQLLAFLSDLGRNAVSVQSHGGKAQGKRYEKSTKLIFEMILKHGGPQAHEFVRVNLEGPVLNTTRAVFRKEAFTAYGALGDDVFKSLHDVLLGHKKRLGITGPIPFEVAEDETGVIRLATFNRRTDGIDGFCGSKTGNPKDHVCSFDLGVVSASTFESITEAFETLKVGTHARLLVLNPLVSGMPRMPLALLSTCMKFNAPLVLDQWLRIRLASKEFLSDVGVVIGHASDGDSKRRKLMLESINRGTYGLNVPGFTMRAENELMDQDVIHGGKKARNSLLSPSKNLFWGKHLATKNHLVLVLQKFDKDVHGLNETDVDVRDKQNYPAVERLALPRVRQCLEELQAGVGEGVDAVREDVKGTAVHLQVLANYIDIFFGQRSLFQRIRQASFVANMLYLGTTYVRYAEGLNLKQNWLTRECLTDLLIGVHFAVNLIRLFRDKFPHLPVPLDKTGSDCCEDIFSGLGSEVINKHNFCLGEGLERLAHISRTEQIKVDDAAPVFAKSRRRQKSWHLGNPIDGPPGNLQDYASVSEQWCVEAWECGLKDARKVAESLDMKAELVSQGKWDEPWHFFSAEAELARLSEESEEDVEDGLTEISEPASTSSTLESEPRPVSSATEVAAEGERGPSQSAAVQEPNLDEFESMQLRLSLLNVLQAEEESEVEGETASAEDQSNNENVTDADTSGAEPDGAGPRSAKPKVATTVHVPGKGQVYKMRLISQLNETPDKLSLDRLRRVQQRAREDHARQEEINDDFHHVALFSNVALWLRDEDRHKVQLAKVQKMFKLGARGGRTDIQHPIPLSTVRDPKIFLICKLYLHDRRTNRYLYLETSGIENEPIPLSSVIISVSSLVQGDITAELSDPLYSITDDREESAILAFVVKEHKRLDANREGSERRLARQKEAAAVASREAVTAAAPVREAVERAPGARRATRIAN